MAPILALVLLLAPQAPADAEEARVALVARLAPAVVSVMALDRPGGGSGVIIDPDGSVLTNFHVVAGSIGSQNPKNRKFMKCGTPDGKLRRARILGLDPGGDLALLRLERGADEPDGPFPFAPLGSQERLRVGDPVLAMGNPFLLATDFQPTVTLGIVSGLRRYQPGRGGKLVYPDCIQTDAAVNPGNSGGPLFDFGGCVAGINGRISVGERGRVNVGVGFAVSADQAANFLPDLRAGRLCAHGSLRLDAREVENDLVVAAIDRDGPAWEAGIRPGDILLALDGAQLHGQNDLLRRISILSAGFAVELSWRTADRIEKTGWIALAPAEPPDEKLEAWEPEEIGEHLARETRRLEGLARQSLEQPGTPDPEALARAWRTSPEPPWPLPPLLGPGSLAVFLPPFPQGAELEGGARVAGAVAYSIALPGTRGERLYLDARTHRPLGAAFSPEPGRPEIELLVTSWRRTPSGLVPAGLRWRREGKCIAETVLEPPVPGGKERP